MKQLKTLADRYRDIQKCNDDINLMLQQVHDEMRQDYYKRKEREQLIQEIVDIALSRLSVSVDTSQAITAIDDLNKKFII